MSDNLIREVLARYEEDFAANTWVVPGGKSRAIQHKCIERMVVRAGISFDPPQMVRADPEMCVMIVTGHMLVDENKRTEWSVGEAAPKNNKNAYPYSMAEKRGKDRVALKLIGLHGLLYSEEEADDFRERTQEPQRQAPAVVRSGPTDRDMANAAPWISEIEACESRADLGSLFRTQEWLDGKASMTAEAQKLIQDALARHPQYQQRAAA